MNPPDDTTATSNNNDTRRNGGSSDNLQQHVLSPRLVDAISRTSQVVWATTRKQEGLIGRSDIRLQTAVGMPVAMDRNGNMCVVVMFSPNNVQSTDDAMEYLHSISQSATSSSIPCLLPVFDSAVLGRMKEILPTSIGTRHSLVADPSATSLGEGVIARFVSLNDTHSFKTSAAAKLTMSIDEPEAHSDHDVTEAPKDTFGIPMLPSFAELGQMSPGPEGLVEAFDEATYGIWTTIMENNEDPLERLADDTHFPANETKNELEPRSSYQLTSMTTTLPPLQESRKERLVEFCLAFLGMSVFDLADVWAPSDSKSPYPPDTLVHVVTVTSTDSQDNPGLTQFQLASERSLIKFWNGAVGRAFATGNPVWSSNENNFTDSGRIGAFQQAHFRTVLAVPVISKGANRPACVVSAYACVKSDSVPFVLRFVQQALRVLWDGLDRIDQPHVSTNVWENVGPSDLGEMAADVEMQQHFHDRKRSHQTMTSSSSEPEHTVPVDSHFSSILANTLSTQLEKIQLPNGDVVSIPFHVGPNVSVCGITTNHEIHAKELQNQVNLALRSVTNSPRSPATIFTPHFVSYSVSPPKRLNLGSGIPAVPLAMPQPLPSQIVSGSSSNSAKASMAPPITVPSAPLNSLASSPPSPAPIVDQNAKPTAPTIPTTTFAASAAINMALLASNVQAQQPPSTFLCVPIGNDSASRVFKVGKSHPGGGKTCRIQGCEALSLPRRPYCVEHSGNRHCEYEGCSKCAQGSTRFCIAHGGGRRCTFPGCDKGARDKFFCAAHGGGKRCRYAGGCAKSAVGGSTFCTSHGGGRRCDVPGCGKSAQSSTNFCVKHGGGKKCTHEGCGKVARGKTSFCAAHGGGIRCKLEGCNRVAIGKLQLCRAHGGGSSRGTSSRNVVLTSAPAAADVGIITETTNGTLGTNDTVGDSMG